MIRSLQRILLYSAIINHHPKTSRQYRSSFSHPFNFSTSSLPPLLQNMNKIQDEETLLHVLCEVYEIRDTHQQQQTAIKLIELFTSNNHFPDTLSTHPSLVKLLKHFSISYILTQIEAIRRVTQLYVRADKAKSRPEINEPPQYYQKILSKFDMILKCLDLYVPTKSRNELTNLVFVRQSQFYEWVIFKTCPIEEKRQALQKAIDALNKATGYIMKQKSGISDNLEQQMIQMLQLSAENSRCKEILQSKIRLSKYTVKLNQQYAEVISHIIFLYQSMLQLENSMHFDEFMNIKQTYLPQIKSAVKFLQQTGRDNYHAIYYFLRHEALFISYNICTKKYESGKLEVILIQWQIVIGEIFMDLTSVQKHEKNTRVFELLLDQLKNALEVFCYLSAILKKDKFEVEQDLLNQKNRLAKIINEEFPSNLKMALKKKISKII